MTKKFVTGVSDNGIDEFVIPNLFDDEVSFLGLKTGKIYREGFICYTGTDLSTTKVMKKILENRSLGFLEKRRARKIIDQYLNQIMLFKISTKVKMGSEFKLLAIKE